MAGTPQEFQDQRRAREAAAGKVSHVIASTRFVRGTSDGPCSCSCGWTGLASGFAAHRAAAGKPSPNVLAGGLRNEHTWEPGLVATEGPAPLDERPHREPTRRAKAPPVRRFMPSLARVPDMPLLVRSSSSDQAHEGEPMQITQVDASEARVAHAKHAAAARHPAPGSGVVTERQQRVWDMVAANGSQAETRKALGCTQAAVQDALDGYMRAKGIEGLRPGQVHRARNAVAASGESASNESVPAITSVESVPGGAYADLDERYLCPEIGGAWPDQGLHDAECSVCNFANEPRNIPDSIPAVSDQQVPLAEELATSEPTLERQVGQTFGAIEAAAASQSPAGWTLKTYSCETGTLWVSQEAHDSNCPLHGTHRRIAGASEPTDPLVADDAGATTVAPDEPEFDEHEELNEGVDRAEAVGWDEGHAAGLAIGLAESQEKMARLTLNEALSVARGAAWEEVRRLNRAVLAAEAAAEWLDERLQALTLG